jgi:hypothetical protein
VASVAVHHNIDVLFAAGVHDDGVEVASTALHAKQCCALSAVGGTMTAWSWPSSHETLIPDASSDAGGHDDNVDVASIAPPNLLGSFRPALSVDTAGWAAPYRCALCFEAPIFVGASCFVCCDQSSGQAEPWWPTERQWLAVLSCHKSLLCLSKLNSLSLPQAGGEEWLSKQGPQRSRRPQRQPAQ